MFPGILAIRDSFPGDVPVLSKRACAPWEQADATCTGQVEASKRKYDALQHHVAAIKLAEAADEDKVHPPARRPAGHVSLASPNFPC